MTKIVPGTVCRIRRLSAPPHIRQVASDSDSIVIGVRRAVQVDQDTVLIAMGSLRLNDDFRTYSRTVIGGGYLLALLADGNIYIVRDTIVTTRMK